MEKIEQPLRIIQRECGGWIALSPLGQPIKIGVTSDTKDDAIRKCIIAIEKWTETLSAYRLSAGLSRADGIS